MTGLNPQTPVYDPRSIDGMFRGMQGPVDPNSFMEVATAAAGIPMGAIASIPYSAGAKVVKGAVSKVTKPVASKVSQVAGSAFNRLKQEFLPAEIGVHHSVTSPRTMRGIPVPPSKQMFDYVLPSGKHGFTANDQIPGYSYFWSTDRFGGAARAVKEADWQTRRIADVRILDEGQDAAVYLTRVPRGTSIDDANIPGTHGRAVKGGQNVIGSFRGTGDLHPGSEMRVLTPQDMRDAAAAINRAKIAEKAKSAAKIAGAGAYIGSSIEGARRNNKR